MGALIIKVFQSNPIYALIISFFNGQPINCFKLFFEIYVTFYLTVDRNECIRFAKFEFCFLVFLKNKDTMLSEHNQNEAVLKRCEVSDAD